MGLAGVIRILCFSATVWLLADGQDCELNMAKDGAEFCQEAVKKTYEENKMKLVTDPIKFPCCINLELSTCMKFAFVSANCAPSDQEYAKAFSDEIKEAQGSIDSIVQKVSHSLCGQITSDECIHYVPHFEEARREIQILNGAAQMGVSLIAFLLSIWGVTRNLF